MRNEYLSFQGQSLEGNRGTTWFKVLCGDNRPKLTDGWAQWTPVARPLRRAVTVFTGYNPVQMDFNLRFGIWDPVTDEWQKDNTAGSRVESNIKILESWGGTRIDLQGGSPSLPSVVYAFANDTARPSEPQSDLIPERYQTTTHQRMPWIINSIQWADNPISNASGYRIYAECTVTMISYLSLDRNPPNPVRPNNAGYFTTNQKTSTAWLIAQAAQPHGNRASWAQLATKILADPKNKKLRLRTTGQKIKPGTKVWIPNH